MKIGINAFFFAFPASGSGEYLLHLLQALEQVDSPHDFVLLGPRTLAQGADGRSRLQGAQHDLPLTPVLPYLAQGTPAFTRRNENVEKLVWEQCSGPAAARKAGVDVLHVPYFAPPLAPRTPTVVTIHDVIPLRLPLYRAGTLVTAYMRLVAFAARRATLIITISQHAKQDIADALRIPPERIRVIYQAAGAEYQPIGDEATLASARARYGLGERYILYLGGLDQRKNVLQLVRAFAQLQQLLSIAGQDLTGLQLLIAGVPDKQRGPLFPDPRPLAAELGVSNTIRYAFIEAEDKAAIYSGASLFVFPSLYEGFGLPPLEAMSCGVPVICSNCTSLPEVVGDAAITLNPDDTAALAAAMREVLTNKSLAADLRARSLQRARLFSWSKTARETVAAYEETLARSRK